MSFILYDNAMFLDKIIEHHLLEVDSVPERDIIVYESVLKSVFESTENLETYIWLFQKGDYRTCSGSLTFVYENFWKLHGLVLDLISNIQKDGKESK